MNQFIIDRIEDGKAVLECENGEFVNIDLSSLPKNIKEGDVLRFDNGSYFFNAEETEQRSRYIKNLMESLFEE